MIALLMTTMQAEAQPIHLAPAIACTPGIVAANTPAGWGTPVAAKSGDTIATGRAATLLLQPAGSVRFAAPLTKPAAAGDNGGIVSFVVPRAGRWRVSLDSPAWIDVVRGTAALTSVAHAHGPICAGIKKTVDFDLPAGRYVLQLSGTSAAAVRVMVAPA